MNKGSRKARLLLSFFLLFTSYLYAESPVSLFEKGNEALDTGNYYVALDFYKQALHINPSYTDALIGLSESYFLLQEYAEALEYSELARKGAGRRIDIMNLQGRIHLGLSEMDLAEKMFNQVLKIEPNNMDAAYGLAEIAVFRGNFREGSDLFERSLVINPDSRRALLSLVALSDKLGNGDKAEYYLSKALSLFPQDNMVLQEATYHYSMTEQWEQAESLALQLISLNPENKDTPLTLGLIYKNTGQYEKAVHFFQESIRNQQENPMIWYYLGKSFEGLDKYDEALLCYKTVNIINPHDEIARISCENLLLRYYPISHEERDAAALWHFEKGRDREEGYQFAKAFSEYRRGRLLSPLNLDGWWQYARILESMDQPNRFRDEMEALYRENYDNLDFLRLHELLMSEEDPSLLAEWDGDVILRDSSLSLSLFVDSRNSRLLHQGGDGDLLRYIGDTLMRNPRFNIAGIRSVETASEAYRSSRSNGSDFYSVLSFVEMERSIRVKCDIFLSRTGTLVSSFDLLRSGNRRISEILLKTADDIEYSLPLKGHLMAVDGDTVLMNLGFINQVEEGISFILLRQGTGRWLDKEPFLDYKEEDVLGTVEVDKVQEKLSLGTLKRNSPFDLVNPGDEVYTLIENMEETAVKEESMNDELKTQLLRLY